MKKNSSNIFLNVFKKLCCALCSKSCCLEGAPVQLKLFCGSMREEKKEQEWSGATVLSADTATVCSLSSLCVVTGQVKLLCNTGVSSNSVLSSTLSYSYSQYSYCVVVVSAVRASISLDSQSVLLRTD